MSGTKIYKYFSIRLVYRKYTFNNWSRSISILLCYSKDASWGSVTISTSALTLSLQTIWLLALSSFVPHFFTIKWHSSLKITWARNIRTPSLRTLIISLEMICCACCCLGLGGLGTFRPNLFCGPLGPPLPRPPFNLILFLDLFSFPLDFWN